MTLKEIQDRLSALVATDMDAGIEEALSVIPADSRVRPELRIIEGSWKDLERDIRMNLLEYARLEVSRARIRKQLIDLIFDLSPADIRAEALEQPQAAGRLAQIEQLLQAKEAEFNAMRKRGEEAGRMMSDRLIEVGQETIMLGIRVSAKGQAVDQLNAMLDFSAEQKVLIEKAGVRIMVGELDAVEQLFVENMPEIHELTRKWIRTYIQAFQLGETFMLVDPNTVKSFREVIRKFQEPLRNTNAGLQANLDQIQSLREENANLTPFVERTREVYAMIIREYHELAAAGDLVEELLPPKEGPRS